MGTLTIDGAGLTGGLSEIVDCDEIVPGTPVGYQTCKALYLWHPLGAKMVDSPIKLATSRPREITVSDAPGEDLAEEFVKVWKQMRCDGVVSQHASVTRIYGLGATILGCVGKGTNEPLTAEDITDGEIFLNIVDPLNTAGSISMDQDPNSPTFQKWQSIAVNGKAYHRSRACVLMNEAPVYIAYTSSAFSFSGRSVYQRVLYPLKSFIQTMATDDMVSRKAGLLVAKMQSPGSIIDNVMAGFAAMKRALLREGTTGGVLGISAGTAAQESEQIESLNLQNIDGAGGWARANILKNIATGGDMPAWFLENETLTSGFGEGSEDAENILRYIDDIREWLGPIYEFLDPIVMRRAWSPAFFLVMKARYPEVYKNVDYEEAFYRWKNSFEAIWPDLKKEDPSKTVEIEKVKLEGVVSIYETLAPSLDPDNKGKLLSWFQDAVSQNKSMFPSPLDLDIDDAVEFMAEQAVTAAQNVGDGEEDDKPPLSLRSDSAAFRARQAANLLEDMRDRRLAG